MLADVMDLEAEEAAAEVAENGAETTEEDEEDPAMMRMVTSPRGD